MIAWLGERCLQLLFPRRCPMCDEIVRPWGEKICLSCLKKLKYMVPPYCMKCGKGVPEGREYCNDCQKAPHLFACGRILYEYGDVSAVVYRFKYGGRREYADFWGEELAVYLGDFIRGTGAQALIPVPLHPRRQRRRGCNQSLLLAKQLGCRIGLPVYEDYVVRTRDTAPLKLLGSKERQNNLKKAFNIKQNDVKLEVAVIIDDIYTTGSTVDGVAAVLLDSGVRRVYFVALSGGTLL